MIKNSLLLCTFAMGTMFSQFASAHGGVSIEQDVCIMKLSPTLKAHFTGYQPEYRATQEFCEDIPVVGKTIFVIDFITDDLRNMNIDFRIIKDVNNIGNRAKLSDLGGPKAIEAATVFHKEKMKYPRGTIDVTYNFEKEGRYIGIVTANYDDNPTNYTSVFPFKVGIFNYWKFVIPVAIIIIVSSGVFGIFLGMSRKQKKESQA